MKRVSLSGPAALLAAQLLCPAQAPTVDDSGARFSTTTYTSPFGSTTRIAGALRGSIYLLRPGTEFLPNFKKLKPVGVIYTTKLNITPRGFTEGFPGLTFQSEWFGIEYTGRFYVDKPTKFEFAVLSDDGAKVFIDGKLLIDNDGIHSPVQEFGSRKLSAGVHHIRIAYFQGPRTDLALVLAIRNAGDAEFRLFDMLEFKLPAELEAQEPTEQ